MLFATACVCLSVPTEELVQAVLPFAVQVRSMYLLLPQLVARDQPGAGDAVAHHFATAHTWDRVLHARVRLTCNADVCCVCGQLIRCKGISGHAPSKPATLLLAQLRLEPASLAADHAEPSVPLTLPLQQLPTKPCPADVSGAQQPHPRRWRCVQALPGAVRRQHAPAQQPQLCSA